MTRISIGLRNVLVVVACLLATATSLPATNEPRGPRHRGWKLPKTDRAKYKGRKAPPAYTAISLGDLNAEFGNVASVAPIVVPSNETIFARGFQERAVIDTDDRTLVKNTSYPYSAIGRLLWSDGTYCTATLVGDRFVVTASHCVPWNNASISIVFQPDFFDSEVFGHAQVTDIAYIRKNDAAAFDTSACGVYYDYSIMRLDTVVSKIVGGTLGVTQWNTTLASKELEAVGYPYDVGAGARPYTQKKIAGSVSSSFQCATDGPLTTKADSSSGQSGGPLFLPGSGTRYIVGTLSASSSTDTVFASGSGLAALTAWGVTNWPA